VGQNARFDQHLEIRQIKPKDLVHLHRTQDNAARNWNAPAEPPTGPARDYRSLYFIGELKDGNNLFDCFGEHDR
jgi:hypothetical protein